MMQRNFSTIDPSQANLPDTAIITKVLSDEERLPADQHDRAVRAFFVSDGIASGIGKDLAFVDKIPQFIKEIIDNKLWECLYVAKGVVTPYYCRYIKSTNAENFRAFITAKRPNGLETSVETIDRVLQGDLEVQRQFRAIIYESRQGERTDLVDETSYGDRKKLENELSQTQRSVVRAANRAAEAVPVIGELLDRGLIAIDLAALLGRDIKDPENLTAEEREYVDKRDLIGLRLDQYIYTNPVPEDEDREPAYGRELNRFVKDLLGIKDRSKSVRMDNPKKAAEKLLQHYQGDNLRALIDCLMRGLEPSANLDLPALQAASLKSEIENPSQKTEDSTDKGEPSRALTDTPLDERKESLQETKAAKRTQGTTQKDVSTSKEDGATSNRDGEISKQLNVPDRLNGGELAELCGVSYGSFANMLSPKDRDKFPEWVRIRTGWTWQPTDEGKGRARIFVCVQE